MSVIQVCLSFPLSSLIKLPKKIIQRFTARFLLFDFVFWQGIEGKKERRRLHTPMGGFQLFFDLRSDHIDPVFVVGMI